MVKPLKGVVVSNKMMKSVTVMVERIYKHPRWGKYVKARKKYMAHDESNMCGPGDKVLMVHSRPLSKHKKWVVTEILRKERVYDHGNVGKKKESLLFDGDAGVGDSTSGATSDDVTGLGAAPQVIGVPSKPTQASFRGFASSVFGL